VIWPERSRKWSMGPLLRDVRQIDRWLEHVTDFRACVQAGGNVGVYPRSLAEHFGTVYTAEPDAENFAALKQNVPSNVVAFQAALGDGGTVGLKTEGLPPLSYHVVDTGDIPCLRVDDWGIDCGLIALDVEGYELAALKGAAQTIARCHPVIVVETGHEARYGHSREDMVDWLKGYRLVDRVGRDEVWA
jgi:FkbM family methyltransferase